MTKESEHLKCLLFRYFLYLVWRDEGRLLGSVNIYTERERMNRRKVRKSLPGKGNKACSEPAGRRKHELLKKINEIKALSGN